MPQQINQWIEITINVCEPLADSISNFMTELGAQGFFEEFPEPDEAVDAAASRADHVVRAYLSKDAELDAALAELDAYIASLASLFPDYPQITYLTAVVDDADWAEGWKKYFKPVRVTEHIVIKPTWEPYAPAEGDVVIEIDPGMAFGTGQHPSTRMCLEALESMQMREAADDAPAVLDVGAGTGILGIAAAKLGARTVTCVDIDELAVEIAAENIRLNGVSDRITLGVDDIAMLRGTFGVVVANLTSKVLIDHRSQLEALVGPGGFLIMSGILALHREDIETCFLTEPFALQRVLTEKEWVCYILRKEDLPR